MGNCLRYFFCTNKVQNEDKAQVISIPKVDKHLLSTIDRLDASDLTTQSAELLYASSVSQNKKISIEDFALLKVIGRGSFGKVMLVEKLDTNELFAMKILKKYEIEKRNQLIRTKGERQILQNMNHPFIVQLVYAFQTQDKLYFVMEFMQGGELFFHLRKKKKFDEKSAKFYIAQILLGLEYLHQNNIIYRDLKPENILLDKSGYIKLADFGLSKQGVEQSQKLFTFCGTAEYIAPEIIQKNGYNKSVDWWSLGILIYEMLAGKSPFMNRDRKKMFHNILNEPVKIQPHFSKEAASLIQALLTVDPTKRMGYGEEDALEIKQHPFFKDIDWNKLINKQIIPQFKPVVKGIKDIRNFDIRFTDLTPENSPTENEIQEQVYSNFTYNADQLRVRLLSKTQED